MRKFNVEGSCEKTEDYMVDINNKLEKIAEMVEQRKYFVINRPRQYGKTTTLAYLEQMLKDKYIVISISFQAIGEGSFKSEENFCLSFIELIKKSLNSANISNEYKKAWFNREVNSFLKLNLHIDTMCKDNKVVLMIDEVDKTSNNQVFLDFLGMLRDKYLARKYGKEYTFHSVILAGVYDIKNIKLKMINEGHYVPQNAEGKLYNSPWNISADFEVDMSFNPQDIETMLKEYKNETSIPMDTELISNEIYKYTSGYPFLVSNICKIIDEKLVRDWSLEGIFKAVKIILSVDNTLSDDLIKNLETYKELYDFLYSVVIDGDNKEFDTHNPIMKLGSMFGYIKKGNIKDKTVIANRIFEALMINYFISKDSIASSKKRIIGIQEEIVKNNFFDMELCLTKFAQHYREIYNKFDVPFFEKHGLLLFITYLKPLINGRGFYHLESQFTDYRRMDIVVDFNKDQFIIELKIWHGDEYKEKAYEQLMGYMDTKNADKGYLLIFDFRIDKEQKTEWVQIRDKKIFCVIV